MCGICGIVDQAGRSDESGDLVRDMARRIAHRGPDQEGYFEDRLAVLGSRRLSIVDLTGGRQPISSEDGTVHVVFNGEIYNFQELRRDLQSRRHHFHTTTDTEVVVHSFEEWGTEALARLNGIFAIALWDAPRRRLVLARDPMGVKPLYYAIHGTTLAFASEVKALLALPWISREVDPHALQAYLSFRFVPSPRTLFRGVHKLAPGECLIFGPDNRPRMERYVPDPCEEDRSFTEEEWTEGFLHELRAAVRRQMMGEVPVGVLLSGGIDSAAILALATEATGSPPQTYTVGFADSSRLDEVRQAAATARAFGAAHRHVTITSTIYRERFASCLYHLDEPVATPSIAPFDALCRLAAEKHKVVLSGQGADEPFGGYPRHRGEKIASHPLGQFFSYATAMASQFRPGSERLERAARSMRTRDPVLRYAETLALFPEQELRQFLGPETSWDSSVEALRPLAERAKHLDPLGRFLYLDARFGLADDLLLYTDKISMAASLEVRVPFLDLELLRFVDRIPASLRVRVLHPKSFLKRALAKILPLEVLSRPKRNFSPPHGAWLDSTEKGPNPRWLLEPGAALVHYLPRAEVARIVEDQIRGRRDRRRQIFALLAFEVWHRTFIDQTIPPPNEILPPRASVRPQKNNPCATNDFDSRMGSPATPGRRLVTHFGPSLSGPGGMSSVLRAYSQLPLSSHRFRFLTTYHPEYALWSVVPFLRACWFLSSRARERIGMTHFHLSKRGSFVREGILVQLARLRGLATCITIHSGDFPRYVAAHPHIVGAVLSKADRVLVLGEAIRDDLERLAGVAGALVLPNAVPLPRSFRLPSECPRRVIFGGDVSVQKGVDTLLLSWAQVREAIPDAELLVAGPYCGFRPCPSPGVTWLGPVPNSRILQLIDESRVAVLPSRCEGMPMFVLEAMAHGRPVVATRVGTLPQVISESGTLVPMDDPRALARALVSYLSDPTLADRVGHAGRVLIEKSFGLGRTAQVLETMYENLVGTGLHGGTNAHGNA